MATPLHVARCATGTSLGSLVTVNYLCPRLCVVWQAARAPAAAKFEKYYVTYANDDAARAGEAALVAGVDSWSDPVFVAGGEAMYKDPFKPPRGACKGWWGGRQACAGSALPPWGCRGVDCCRGCPLGCFSDLPFHTRVYLHSHQPYPSITYKLYMPHTLCLLDFLALAR
jgi:hypothetical protein